MGSIRSVAAKRRVLTVVLLALLMANCSGDGPSRHEAEQQGESGPAAATNAATTEETATTTSAAPLERERKPRALVWVAVEGANQLVLVDLAKGKILARQDAPGGPHNITVADDGVVAATLYGSDRIVLVGRREARFLELGGNPHDAEAPR
jgi:hypothetical protein